MLQAIALESLQHAAVFLLSIVLAGVNTDDDERVSVLFFETGEVRDDLLTVDAAGGPEVQQDDLAAQRFDREGAADVEPGVSAGELRSLRERVRDGNVVVFVRIV